MSVVPMHAGPHGEGGIFVSFGVPVPSQRAPGHDLDNLLDPVLSAVVNGQGWFGGRRPLLRWVAAQKEVQIQPGARIALLAEAPELWDEAAEVVLDAVYQADPPNPATMGAYEQWVRENGSRSYRFGGVGVAIDFARPGVNIGDIGTGPVKTMIDGLWPILGGRHGAPHDGRVAALRIRKGVTGVDGDASVKVVGLA